MLLSAMRIPSAVYSCKSKGLRMHIVKWKSCKNILKRREHALPWMLGLAFCFALSACDPTETKIQYMPDMADGPLLKPQRTYIDPPDGAVSRQAILYPKTIEEAEATLHSPYNGTQGPQTKAYLEEGKVLFETFCSVCHGTDAKGGGTITDKFPRPPDITADAYAKRGDGFFFHRITFGSALMPSYGDKVSAHERWKIILHLRTLQNKVELK
jgi:mono/diheme cytochrome c family protein